MVWLPPGNRSGQAPQKTFPENLSDGSLAGSFIIHPRFRYEGHRFFALFFRAPKQRHETACRMLFAARPRAGTAFSMMFSH
ncbi:MAG: hypothetical protein SOV63_06555 [Pyramidobacter porci]|uniref:hypothetical protein n=1 Tax=Pyramidobacter porci TaxID=2605789 RepID=UPI002A757D97|nr:hypothetical protein [Pyramidobacter porci]MDY2648452.1 hypothetical protein [Pyramidobacter porci]